jgi:uncharacterized membrane protein YqaE (UPF0057 family)
MHVVLALIVPWLVFHILKRRWARVLSLLLQMTLVGWLPASLWALYALARYEGNKQWGALERKILSFFAPSKSRRQ